MMEELTQKLTIWIREQVTAAGCQGAVFGMSGGIDSAAVAVLCQRAFPSTALGVYLPCHSLKTSERDARIVARRFHIPLRIISLDEAYDSLVKVLPSSGLDPATQIMAEANLKPRLRMAVLFYLANRLRYLVVGTSNKSELSIGYFTKYGDGAADILPLGNMVKRQVRELASHLGIPKKIIEKPPSAELWEGQTDEQEIGITYEDLDRYLTSKEASSEVQRRVETMIASSMHKRRTPPTPPF